MSQVFGILLVTANFNYLDLFNTTNENFKYIFKLLPLFIILIISIFQNKIKSVFLIKIIKIYFPLIILLFFGMASFFWSPNPQISLEKSTYTILIIFVISVYSMYSSKNLETCINNTILISIIPIVFVFFIVSGVVLGFDNEILNYQRFGGTLIHPNALGMFISYTIIILINSFFLNKKLSLFKIIVLVLLIYMLLLTRSRSSLLLTIIITFLSLIYLTQNMSNKFFLFCISFSIILFLILTNNQENYLTAKSFIYRGQAMEDLLRLNNRMNIWELLALKDLNIIYGNGYQMLSDVEHIQIGNFITVHAHNGYVQILGGLGLIGIFLLFLFIKNLYSYSKTIKDIKIKKIFNITIIFYLFSNFTISGFGFHIYPHVVLFHMVICNLIILNTRK